MELTPQDWERSESFERWRKVAFLPVGFLVALLVLFQDDVVKTLASYCETQSPLIGNSIFIAFGFAVLCLFTAMVTAPTFLVGRRFGLISLSVSGFALLTGKRLLVMGLFYFPFAAWARFASVHFQYFAAWIILAIIVMGMVHSAIFVPVIMRFYFRLSDLPDGELKQRAQAMFTRIGIGPMPIRVLHVAAMTSASNAMAAGFGKYRGVILTDTLLRDFAADEIESVIAHELGHIQKHHLFWRNALCIAILMPMTAVISFMTQSSADLRRLEDFYGVLAASVFAWAVSRILVGPLSRKQEFEADEFSVRLISDPQVYTRALTKLHAKMMGLTRNANSHPSLQKRLRRIYALTQQRAASASA